LKSENGTRLGVDLSSGSGFRQWTIGHLLTSAEFSSLDTFYDARNAVGVTEAFDFTDDSDDTLYEVKFAARPRIVRTLRDDLHLVEVRLVSVQES
jgi:hypothetical protein